MIKIETIIRSLPKNASVLDVGCFGYQLQRHCVANNRPDIINHGVDYSESEGIPAGYVFKRVDLNRQSLPFPDAQFDFVLAAHVIEHLADGVSFFTECVRVLKPGGQLFVICPSERSLFQSGFPFSHEKFCSSSFFDDPTHLGRPYSPQSLYRLARYCAMEPQACGYDDSAFFKIIYPVLYFLGTIARDAVFLEKVIWKAKGWASFLLALKPDMQEGGVAFNYYVPERSSFILESFRPVKRWFLAIFSGSVAR